MKNHFPATFVQLPPETEGRRAAFYLAAEEYIADALPQGSYFFTWQISPTVVMGRNQVMHQEIDLDFCRHEGIDVIRRRSGGGAIFADERNIMTSLITEFCPVEPLFHEYAEAVAEALRSLGAPAQVSGRNDITLEENGGKICGNAFYQKTDRCIAHGTMLYDTNPRLMEGALHPDLLKLKQKGVKSVRSRVGLLKDYLSTIDVRTLREKLRTLLCDRTVALTDGDVRHIEQQEQRYYLPDYLYGSSAHADIIRRQRIEGCGTVELHISLSGSLILDVCLAGDYFCLGDADTAFRTTFTGLPFTPDRLTQAIRQHHPEQCIRGLTEEALIGLLTGKELS